MYKYIFVFAILIISCAKNRNQTNDKEKYMPLYNNIINVKDKIIEINTQNYFGYPMLYIVDDYLVLVDMKSVEQGIYLYDKNSFKFIARTGILGRGPGEIGRYGILSKIPDEKSFLLQDDEKKCIWKFNIDSIISDSLYRPQKFIDYMHNIFMVRYKLISNNIALGKAIKVLNNNSYSEIMAKVNFFTNTLSQFGYVHPKLNNKKTRSAFNLSLKNNEYVNAYFYEDLITVCNLQGKLKYNIYGKNWLNNNKNRKSFYSQVDFMGKLLIASYKNTDDIVFDKFKRPKGNSPSTFLIFDNNGNYIHSLFTGYEFSNFCIDETNKRIIVYFNKNNPLGYIDYKAIADKL